MAGDAKSPLLRRLSMLYALERGNIVLLPICMVIISKSLMFPLDWAAWLAILASSILLIQGTYYWKVKLDSLTHREDRFLAHAATFRAYSRINPYVLGAIGITIVVIRLISPVPAATISVTLGFYALAIAEHINYYDWQLMHDNLPDLQRLLRTGIRRSQLWHDLRRAERKSKTA